MVLFNYATKEITAKVVYYGPGLCGKTTNLQFIYDSLPSNSRSKMLSLATKTDRTLFFDFLPLDLGKIRGMRTKLQLYTVPGQVYYNSTRQLVLKGADGVVFVADSQDFALDANMESLQNLEDNLKRQGIRITEIPLVFQYNKRDLPNALPLSELEETINKRLRVPSFESVATTGLGVEQSLKGITQLVLSHLVKKYGLEGSEPLEKDIQVLNAPIPPDPGEATETLWSDEEVAAAAVSDDDDIPLVETELLPPDSNPPSPFEDLIGRFETPVSAGPSASGDPFDPFAPTEAPPIPDQPSVPFMSAPPAPAPVRRTVEEPMQVPTASIEIPLPSSVLNSLPDFGAERKPAPAPPPAAAAAAAPAAPAEERRNTDGLVREVTIPLNLSVEELRRHKKLKLKITLDVNLLP
jgi:mutual gliding-motility protein MglA